MKTELIKFSETELFAYTDEDDKIWIPVKPICDAIGISADSAGRSIKNHKVLGAVHTIQSVQVGQNQAREYICLPIQHVHGWLFTIEIGKVKPESQAVLVFFQEECFNVLYNHFNGRTKVVVQNSEKRFQLLKEIDRLKTKKYGIEQRIKEVINELNQLDTETFTQLELFKSSLPITPTGKEPVIIYEEDCGDF